MDKVHEPAREMMGRGDTAISPELMQNPRDVCIRTARLGQSAHSNGRVEVSGILKRCRNALPVVQMYLQSVAPSFASTSVQVAQDLLGVLEHITEEMDGMRTLMADGVGVLVSKQLRCSDFG